MDTSDAKRLSLMIIVGMSALYIAIEGLYGKCPFTILRNGLPNVIATTAALAAGALITLAVVEQALKEDKEKIWKGVRERTYIEIIDCITEIPVSVLLSIPHGLTHDETEKVRKYVETIKKKEGRRSAETIGLLWDLLNEAKPRIIEACGKVSEEQAEQDVKMIKLVYKDIKFSLGVFRTIFVPRVLDFSENDKLRDVLINFEISSLEYENYMRAFYNPLYATKPALQSLMSLIDLLYAAANVYWFISVEIEKDS